MCASCVLATSHCNLHLVACEEMSFEALARAQRTSVHLNIGLQDTMSCVQPDQPRLCVFYLEGLLAALMTTGPKASWRIMQGLITFLWRCTWASVPDFLRALLLDALLSAGTRWGAGSAELGADVCRVASLSVAVAWALQGDDTFVSWVTQQPRHAILQCRFWRKAATRTGSDTARCVAATCDWSDLTASCTTRLSYPLQK